MIKLSALEDTQVTDPVTGLPIRVSTTTRIMYRYVHRNNPELGYDKMRNDKLNQIIANDFVQSASKVVHHFRLKTMGTDGQPEVAEIRNRAGSAMFFITKISGGAADILVLQPAYRPPRYKKAKK